MPGLYRNTLIILFMIATALLQAAEPDPYQIMKKAYSSQNPDEMESVAYMALRDADGTTNTRKLKIFTKKAPAGAKTFIEFLLPADVKGTKFLTIGNKSGEDDQRIYIPELGKVRKIASSSKNQTFMGSDLTYYDMEDRDVEDSSYTFVSTDTVNLAKDGEAAATECWVIESVPKDSSAPYSKSRIWISKGDFAICKSELYDKNGDLVKTIHIVEIKKSGAFIIPVKTLVVNVNGHKTLIKTEEIKVDHSIPDSVFTIQNLER
ncbi:MAG: outer membrane lipoprotein-sorting protein [Spirochaetales bacterium]|nr:outer membrane lipoprotein-sorting protein [Spirochaetales bacterium]